MVAVPALGQRTVGSLLAISEDGALAAVVEEARVAILDVPNCKVRATIDIQVGQAACAVGWIGPSPRLLVLESHGAQSSIRLVDPNGQAVTGLSLDAEVTLLATLGNCALVSAGTNTAVVAASATALTPYPLPLRISASAAGAGPGVFVVALPLGLEEWDPLTRLPKRRFKLPRPAAVTHVGSNARAVWWTTQQHPARIEVHPLINRKQPTTHELPEAIASIAGHPRSDLLACIGTESGKVYVVDLDGRERTRTLTTDAFGRVDVAALVVGRDAGVVVARGDERRWIAFAQAPIPVAGADESSEPLRRSTLGHDDAAPPDAAVERSTLGHDDAPSNASLMDATHDPDTARPTLDHDTARPTLDPATTRSTLDPDIARPSGGTDGAGSHPAPPHFAPAESPPLTPAPPPRLSFDDVGPLRGLRPIPTRATMPASTIARLLDDELETVKLRAFVAIALGWDTRRIGFANESAHPYEQEVAAILGLNQGHASDRLIDARNRLAEHEVKLRHDTRHRGSTTPLGLLAAELGLSPLAIDILMIVAAPALRGELGRLYSVIANDTARTQVDELLVHQILGETGASRLEISRELDPTQPLARFGLVATSGRPRPFSTLTIEAEVLARLLDQPVAFPAGSALELHRADRKLEELLLPPLLVLAALRYLERDAIGDHQPRIALRGRPGSGRRTLLAALSARAGRDVAIIDATRLPRDLDAYVDALRTSLRRAQLRQLVPCVIGTEDVAFEHASAKELIKTVFRSHPGPIAVRLPADAAVPFDADHLSLDLPMPNEGDRLAEWKSALAAAALDGDAVMLATRYRIGPGTIHTTVAGVQAARATAGTVGGNATAELEQILRQSRELRLGEHARRVDRMSSWDALVLPDDTMHSLRELVGRVRHRRTVYEQWGFDRTMSTSRGLTALFQGPPGTGKTMVAGVIARELGLELYQVDLSRVMSKWIGETEKNLAAIFDAAEDGQLVLLFDEADSLFGKRSEIKSSNDRFANLEVNFLLQRLDSFEGIAILTTNFGGSLDPAFQRRLSFRLTFPFPDEEIRKQLWEVHLPPELPVSGPLDLKALAAKYRLAGGYIRNACLRAAFLAASEGSGLAQRHLEKAVTLEMAELGKLSTTSGVE